MSTNANAAETDAQALEISSDSHSRGCKHATRYSTEVELGRGVPDEAVNFKRGLEQFQYMTVNPTVRKVNGETQTGFAVTHDKNSDPNVDENGVGEYFVRSEVIEVDGQQVVVPVYCTCMHHIYRMAWGVPCKHMVAVMLYLSSHPYLNHDKGRVESQADA